MPEERQDRMRTQFSPADEELAAEQWAEWRVSRRSLLRVGAFGGGAIVLSGVAATGRPFLQSAAAQDQPKSAGKVAMSLADQDVQNFDPIIPTDNMSIWTMLLIYDQLIRVASDGKSLEPGLAEKWDVSQDGLTYTFHLRDAKFHDGSPVTADDVVYSLTRVVQSKDSQWSFLFSAVDKVEASDPKTAVIRLKTVWAPFESDLALFGASIIPQKLHQAQQAQLFQKPVGTGPFVFDSWDKGNKIVLKKNPNYWTAGKPYLDELDFFVLTDANARMLQFQGGQLDIATLVPFSQIDSLKSNSDYTVLSDAVARIDYMGINVKRAPFDNVKLRQAMNLAVDKDAIIKNILFGNGEAANTYLPKMPYHDDSASVPYPFDLTKAQDLVKQSSGKNGFKAEILTGSGDTVGNQVAQLVAVNLSKIGGQVKITPLEPGLYNDRIQKSQDFDLYVGYYTTDIVDPDELTSFAVQSDGGTLAVWTQYKNDQVDALIKQGQVELDKEKRLQMYKDIQKMVAADAHFIYLYYPGGNTVTTNKIKDFHILPTGNYHLWETWRTDV
jgi:peptide/nickel transport system substrate-binding protein